MKRKVVEQGGSTKMISLPAVWVKRFNVKKGDELEVTAGRDLIIKSDTNLEPNEVIFDISKLSDLEEERVFLWIMSALYKTGFDHFKIIYKNPERIKRIKEILKEYFIGMIITMQDEKSCEIKTVSKEYIDEFDTVLRRAFLVNLEIGKMAVDYIKKRKFANMIEIKTLKQSVSQLTNYCERILNKYDSENPKKRCFLYVITSNLHKCSQSYKILYGLADPYYKDMKVREKTIKLFEKTNKFLEEIFNLYFKFDLEKLDEVIKNDYFKLRKEAYELIKNPGKEGLIITSIIDLIGKIGSFPTSFIAINEIDKTEKK